ncbi:MAG: efflux RND transporter periplasmic adaptor subunit, partial [Candidatus Omnitrophica bacterium]|nr:efflux RND transporter periplasmic adaptor subunit [Candidatus Omnitrophota bacterium]
MKHQFKWTVLILAAAAGLGTWFFTHKAAPKDESVKTFVTAVRGDLSVTIQAMGVIQPQNRLEMKSPVAGRVDEVLVREGQDVRVGDTVALLSSTERAALLDAARSQGEEVIEHWKTIYKPVPLIAPISGKVIVSTMQPGQSVTQNDAVIVLSDRLIVQAQV